MPYNPPTYGETGEVYTDNVRNSLAAVKTQAELAQSTADGLNASVTAASQTADEAREIAEAAKAFVESPADDRVAGLVGDTASATATALSATYAKTRAADGSQITVDRGTSSYLNWRVGGADAGYAIHLTSDTDFAGSGLIGLGNDFGTKTALLVNNKAQGAGITLHNQSTVTGAGGHGFYGLNSAPAASSLFRLEQQSGAVRGPLLTLIGQTTDTTAKVVEWQKGNDRVGWITAEGDMWFEQDTADGIAGRIDYARVNADGVRLYASASGTNTLYWVSQVGQHENLVRFTATTSAAAVGSESMTRKWLEYDMFNNRIGFFGVTPVARATVAAAATDAATTQALANDLRAKLIALGLVA